ncbi:MAG: prephenate dehydrogenase [Phycisphaerae bacterium]
MRKARKFNDLSKVTIVGVGLLGGSIGLAVRAAGSRCLRVGIGRRRRSIERARRLGAIDQATTSFRRGLRDAELVIVATPLGQFEQVFTAMAGHLPAGCVITDVGSAKVQPTRLAEGILPPRVRFVGSHPIAGSEKAGVEFARAELFCNAPCIVTPSTTSDRASVGLVVSFWRALGCRVRRLSPERHDRLMASLSHLPHMVASCLVLLAAEDRALDLAGPGLMDTTRIASGQPALWCDILRCNRRPALLALRRLQKRLTDFGRALQAPDDKELMKILRSAKRRRDALIRSKPARRERQP